MPLITIQGTPINFPNSGASPNWAPAVIEFAQAVETALSSAIGDFDVSPQTLNIDAANPASDIDITPLNFPPDQVQAAFIRYAVYRETDSTSGTESGTLSIVYNPDGTVGNKWELITEFAGPGASISFYVTDLGQVQYTTTTLAGSNHTGYISFVAQALKQE